MRYLKMLGALAFALALGAIPCSAQWQGNIPPGSYAQTCRDIHTDGNRLDAECQSRDGNWRRSSLDHLDQCGGGIINDDGHLVCGGNNGYGYPDRDRDRDQDRDRDRDHGYRSGWQGNIPPGDYAQTCRNIRNNGNRLEAECQKRNGGWRKTTLDNLDQCSGGVINNDGHLQCGAGGGYAYGSPDRGYRNGWQGNIPRGDYAQTCRNIRANGDRLDAECQTRGGNWRKTSLHDVDRCNAPIANDDGHLVCAGSR